MAKKYLTDGPVWHALASVSAPMTFGILAVLSVGLADAYFLGQLGQAPLAAIGFVYPVTTAITSLSLGLSAGANAAVSQAIGKGSDSDAPARLALHALGLGLLLAIAVAVAFWALSAPIFVLMGASDAALIEAKAYAPFWAVSFPFLVVMMVTNAAFRANGDGATSAAIMVLGALINIALNPLLIFTFELGTQGAAIATAIGRAFGAVVAVVYAFHTGVLSRCANVLSGVAHSIRQVLTVGVPAALSNAINPAGISLVTAAVATLGDAAVAGFGAATRVQSVALVPLFALSAGIGPVVGQNWGANKRDRARTGVRDAWVFCGGYGVLLAIVLTSFANPLAGVFIEDGKAKQYAAQYLSIVGWSLFGYGVLVTANAAMNARSKAGYSVGLSLARIFAVYVPLAWLGLMTFGYSGILAAAVMANVFAVGGAWWSTRRTGLHPFHA
ncbi:MATE family efflux transporter [Marivita sp. S0852]|uniref:MATE family efflux transporter n=1 Tax=Marivita sp. S0852 TaxID=3373893 RepID=UPI0039824EA8